MQKITSEEQAKEILKAKCAFCRRHPVYELDVDGGIRRIPCRYYDSAMRIYEIELKRWVALRAIAREAEAKRKQQDDVSSD